MIMRLRGLLVTVAFLLGMAVQLANTQPLAVSGGQTENGSPQVLVLGYTATGLLLPAQDTAIPSLSWLAEPQGPVTRSFSRAFSSSLGSILQVTVTVGFPPDTALPAGASDLALSQEQPAMPVQLADSSKYDFVFYVFCSEGDGRFSAVIRSIDRQGNAASWACTDADVFMITDQARNAAQELSKKMSLAVRPQTATSAALKLEPASQHTQVPQLQRERYGRASKSFSTSMKWLALSLPLTLFAGGVHQMYLEAAYRNPSFQPGADISLAATGVTAGLSLGILVYAMLQNITLLNLAR
ncbi:MAG: hypothetical protein N2067_08205 [Spirochaetaceae bacterium]|nr:hypothetical protein [Spirochaetaceae bacterium]